MVWGCVTCNGVGRLGRISGTIKYAELLEKALLKSLKEKRIQKTARTPAIDNDLKHRSPAYGTAWFKKNRISLFPWPS